MSLLRFPFLLLTLICAIVVADFIVLDVVNAASAINPSPAWP